MASFSNTIWIRRPCAAAWKAWCKQRQGGLSDAQLREIEGTLSVAIPAAATIDDPRFGQMMSMLTEILRRLQS